MSFNTLSLLIDDKECSASFPLKQSYETLSYLHYVHVPTKNLLMVDDQYKFSLCTDIIMRSRYAYFLFHFQLRHIYLAELHLGSF